MLSSFHRVFIKENYSEPRSEKFLLDGILIRLNSHEAPTWPHPDHQQFIRLVLIGRYYYRMFSGECTSLNCACVGTFSLLDANMDGYDYDFERDDGVDDDNGHYQLSKIHFSVYLQRSK